MVIPNQTKLTMKWKHGIWGWPLYYNHQKNQKGLMYSNFQQRLFHSTFTDTCKTRTMALSMGMLTWKEGTIDSKIWVNILKKESCIGRGFSVDRNLKGSICIIGQRRELPYATEAQHIWFKFSIKHIMCIKNVPC